MHVNRDGSVTPRSHVDGPQVVRYDLRMGTRALFITALVAAGSAAVAVACASFSSDSGSAGAVDGSTGGEAGAVPADPGVFCGGGPTAYCDPQTEVCCKHLAGGAVGCLPAANAAMCQGTDLACDDGADCAFMAGGVCCGVLGSNGVDILESRCYTLSQCKTMSFYAVVCDPNAPNACPGVAACNPTDGGAYAFCEGLVHP